MRCFSGANREQAEQLRHGLSQTEVAQRLGISRQAVQHIEQRAMRKLRRALRLSGERFPTLLEGRNG